MTDHELARARLWRVVRQGKGRGAVIAFDNHYAVRCMDCLYLPAMTPSWSAAAQAWRVHARQHEGTE